MNQTRYASSLERYHALHPPTHPPTHLPIQQCAIYFLNFFLDTTIGVFISYLFLQLLQKSAKKCGSGGGGERGCTSLTRSGFYGDAHHPSLSIWAIQLFSWLVIIFATKLVVSLLIYVAWRYVQFLTH